MTLSELKKKYPKTWADVKSKMDDKLLMQLLRILKESGCSVFRYYFDSVGIHGCVQHEWSNNEFWYEIDIMGAGELIGSVQSATIGNRKEAETACIKRCFEIREEQLITIEEAMDIRVKQLEQGNE